MADELDPQTEKELEAAEAADVVEETIDEAEAVEEMAEVIAEEVAEAGVEATESEVVEAAEEAVAELTEEMSEELEDEAAEVAPTKEIPTFRAGDTLRLGLRIKEGDKTRTQYFEGMVLARKGAGISQSFTIRKIGAGGIAVERIFPVYSPTIVSYEVRRRGVVRRAKIYFLRDIVGSTANVIKERKVAKEMIQVQEARATRKAAKAEKKAAKVTTKKAAPKAATKSTRSAKRTAKKA